jgi:mono/diheme cytochrome c family protein
MAISGYRIPGVLLTVLAMVLLVRMAAADERLAFFESKVRPVLAEHCFRCHGPEKQNNGLRLDRREGWVRGTDYGPVVNLDDVGSSRVLKALRHEEGVEAMPREGQKLSGEAVAAVEQWLRDGMPWPEGGGEAVREEAWRRHWAFQKVKMPAVPGPEELPDELAGWRGHPLDRLVAKRLLAGGILPSGDASRSVLLKRASVLLHGVPPGWKDVQEFVADGAEDAWERRVDAMLASPRFGERWARHWMDIARYADTKGYVFQEERRYAYAYTYRDWLIRAFHEDMPYDRFLELQIAADRLTPADRPADLAAMGFLTLGRRFLNNQHDIIDDRLDVVFRGTQALTVGCARCHDHKFDPVPISDYYALYGVFANSEEPAEKPAIGAAERTPELEAFEKGVAERQAREQQYREERLREIFQPGVAAKYAAAVEEAGEREGQELREFARGRDLNPVVLARWREWVRSGGAGEPAEAEPLRSLTAADLESGYNRKHREALNALRQETEKFKATSPAAPPRAMVLVDRAKATEPVVFIRGNPGRPGPRVERRFLSCLSEGEPQPLTEGSGRLQLARAIASRDNPLTARVFVNRVWGRLFGVPLVDAVGDFGVRTAPPVQPELLDWAAASFMEQGWSLKKFLRNVLLSRAWRQDSVERADAAARDPENRLHWRQNRQRLDFEALRDSLVEVCGGLDPEMHGRSVDLLAEPYTHRRAVYGFIDRQNLPGTFRTFDFAGPDNTAPRRFETTVPQQSLYLMNNPFVQAQARRVVAAVDAAGVTDAPGRVRELFRRLLQREPDGGEMPVQLAAVASLQGEPRQSGTRWQYGRGRWAGESLEFVPFSWHGSGRWSVSGDLPDPEAGWVMLQSEGGHPGADAAVRRWNVAETGRVRLSGKVVVKAKESDGVRAVIRHSRLGILWQAKVSGGGEAEASVASVAVEPGDTLDFAVDRQGHDHSDSFGWAPRVVDEVSGVELADAARDFGGPGLSAWEAYAQVLLCTSEFLFAD